jgi:hypothetical protein
VPAAERHHHVEEEVREQRARDRDAELVRVREVDRAHAPGGVDLSEEDFLVGPALRAPLAEPPLQRPELSCAEPTGVSSLKLGEHRLGLQRPVVVGHEQRLHLARPDVDERILARAVLPRRLRLRRQRAALPCPRCPLAHPCGRACGFVSHALHPLLPQQADLLVGDHARPLERGIDRQPGIPAQPLRRAVRTADRAANLVPEHRGREGFRRRHATA